MKINVIKPELTPFQFGARGDGSDDTAAFRRAITAAARLQRPLLIPSGDFLLVPPSSPSWYFRNDPKQSIYICVPLLSDLTVVGRGGRIITRAPQWSLGEHERVFLFGTGFNLAHGTFRNIHFDEVEIDFANEFGAIHNYTYAFGVTGVDCFEQRNLKLSSTGKRAGRGLFFLNGCDRKQTGCSHKNMVQGHYIHYEWNPIVRDVSFECLSECMDWDGPAWGVDARGLTFKNLINEAQCIDSAGGSGWRISDVTAHNTGSVFFLYHKLDTYPTFTEWHQSPVGSYNSGCVTLENVVISKVRGLSAGRGFGPKSAETFRVGLLRSRKYPADVVGVPPPRNITIDDMEIDGGFAACVNECENLQMRHVRLYNMDSSDDVEKGAALNLRQSTATEQIMRESELSGVVRDLTIDKSRGAGMIVDTPSNLTLRDISIEGYNLGQGAHTRKGLDIRGVGRKIGVLELEDIRVTAGVGKELTDISVRGSAVTLRDCVRTQGTLMGSSTGAKPLKFTAE